MSERSVRTWSSSWLLLGQSTCGSRSQQGLDGATFIHRTIALGDLFEGEREVEDLSGIDLPVPHEVDEVRQEAPHWRRAAVEVDVREEQTLTVEGHAVRHADVAHEAARSCGAD